MSPIQKFGILVPALLFTLIVSAHAADFSIPWSTIDGGGGTSASNDGRFSLNGTIGQTDAGAMMAEQYSLTGGFWSLAAVQTPGAPLLSITRSATNTFIVWWPSPSTCFNLKQNANLNTSSWVAPPETVIDNGTIKYIVVLPPSSNRFFRLVCP